MSFRKLSEDTVNLSEGLDDLARKAKAGDNDAKDKLFLDYLIKDIGGYEYRIKKFDVMHGIDDFKNDVYLNLDYMLRPWDEKKSFQSYFRRILWTYFVNWSKKYQRIPKTPTEGLISEENIETLFEDSEMTSKIFESVDPQDKLIVNEMYEQAKVGRINLMEIARNLKMSVDTLYSRIKNNIRPVVDRLLKADPKLQQASISEEILTACYWKNDWSHFLGAVSLSNVTASKVRTADTKGGKTYFLRDIGKIHLKYCSESTIKKSTFIPEDMSRLVHFFQKYDNSYDPTKFTAGIKMLCNSKFQITNEEVAKVCMRVTSPWRKFVLEGATTGYDKSWQKKVRMLLSELEKKE